VRHLVTAASDATVDIADWLVARSLAVPVDDGDASPVWQGR
jgi:hypothetical protein